jgi:hypothetical protein
MARVEMQKNDPSSRVAHGVSKVIQMLNYCISGVQDIQCIIEPASKWDCSTGVLTGLLSFVLFKWTNNKLISV